MQAKHKSKQYDKNRIVPAARQVCPSVILHKILMSRVCTIALTISILSIAEIRLFTTGKVENIYITMRQIYSAQCVRKFIRIRRILLKT